MANLLVYTPYTARMDHHCMAFSLSVGFLRPRLTIAEWMRMSPIDKPLML
ncbi:hypothetical protein KBY93_08470 [Synechococcus sp. J7-Johnson]|nr:hypothetical protein [Synechococcus sp. J7-Johnson]MCP9840670.1 hypothetical protein [Synechococcus sp. J7-Johnson]